MVWKTIGIGAIPIASTKHPSVSQRQEESRLEYERYVFESRQMDNNWELE